MNRRRAAALMFMVLMVPQLSLADIVVLRNGEEIRGAVANRDRFRAVRGAVSVVSILRDSTGGAERMLRRIARGDIDHVILEEPDGKTQVYDMDLVSESLMQELAASEARAPMVRRRRISGGVGLSVFGAGTAILGAAAKFGEGRVVATATRVRVEDKSYNALNYGLMFGGAALFVGGVVWATTQPRTAVGIVVSPESQPQLAVTVRF